jgi:hypothetical protein
MMIHEQVNYSVSPFFLRENVRKKEKNIIWNTTEIAKIIVRMTIVIIILFTNSKAYGEGTYNDFNYRGIGYLYEKIGLGDLLYLKKNDLRIVRNAIYAKHGYIFKSQDLMDFFSQFSWYNGIRNNIDNYLNEIDWYNISLILEVERNYPDEAELTNNHSIIPDRFYLFSDWQKDWYLSEQWEYIRKDRGIETIMKISFCFNGIYDYYWHSKNENGIWEYIVEGEEGLWTISDGKIELTPLPRIPDMLDINTIFYIDNFISTFDMTMRMGYR